MAIRLQIDVGLDGSHDSKWVSFQILSIGHPKIALAEFIQPVYDGWRVDGPPNLVIVVNAFPVRAGILSGYASKALLQLIDGVVGELFPTHPNRAVVYLPFFILLREVNLLDESGVSPVDRMSQYRYDLHLRHGLEDRIGAAVARKVPMHKKGGQKAGKAIAIRGAISFK